MGTFTTLPHEQIAAYARGEGDHDTHAQIRKLAAENGSFQLLLELIDRVKPRARIRQRPAAAPLPGTFAAMEEMLLRFFAGNAGDDEAQLLINGLVASPQFYQRLMAKLEQIAPPDETPDMEHIKVRTDEELLAQIKAGAAMEARNEAAIVRARSTATIWERLRDWFKAILRVPRPAFAIPLMIAGIFLLYHQFFKSGNIDDAYVFDEKVPYAYGSGLRGASPASEEDMLFDAFESNFKLSMSDYVVCNYPGAIEILKNLKTVAGRIKPVDKRRMNLLRDYYFYFGLSHFALSRSRRFELTAEGKKQNAQSAIQYLARADSLALALHLEENDRETFFLGLSYGLGGQRDSALVRLHRIKPKSDFYAESFKLIQEWSKE